MRPIRLMRSTSGMRASRRSRARSLALSRALSGALLAFGVLCGPAVLPALADDAPSAPASDGAEGSSGDEGAADGGAPTEAGTSFRTAEPMRQDQRATADASTGDYLYWSFPADAGQRPTVRASVTLPASPARHAASRWQVDVYDGLRRRQPCMYGMQARTVAPDAGSAELSCTLRPVRGWAETWADDPLPGTYYVRLTAIEVGAADVGLPVRVSVEAVSHAVSGAHAVGGGLAQPLVPGVSMATASASGSESGSGSASLAGGEPEGGWSSGWWSDRWIWTAVGGALAALAGVGGYALTRRRAGQPGA